MDARDPKDAGKHCPILPDGAVSELLVRKNIDNDGRQLFISEWALDIPHVDSLSESADVILVRNATIDS
jgi:hypothetical protein